jgi:predicted transcriptional regulator
MTFKCINCGKNHHVKEYHMKKLQKFCSQRCVTEYIGHNNRKIDQVILEEMKTLRDQGLTYKEIADKLRFSRSAVRTNLLKSYGSDVVKHQFTHVNQGMFGDMKVLSEKGFSTRKIAAKIGISKSTAARYLSKSGKPALPPLSITVQRSPIGKVDQAMLEKIKALRDKGFSYTKIATIVGLCRPTVKIHLKSYKPAITILHPSRKVTLVMIEDMKILRNEGLTYEKIGSKLGVATKTVWKYLKS